MFGLLNCANSTSRGAKEQSVQEYVRKNWSSYSSIYLEITKEISKMKKENISSTLLNTLLDSKVDSLIVFNKNRDKLYTTLNSLSKPWEGGSSDLIQSLYGVKIEGKWHIYVGQYNLIAMRDGYKYDIYEPFTWEELSYMAHEQLFGRFIIFKDNGIAINYKRLDEETSVRSLTGKTLDEVESESAAFIELTEYYNSRKIDSTQLERMKEDMVKGKQKPKLSYQPKVTWWDKLWGAEEPIFETKEWKEYLRQKYGDDAKGK